MRGEDDQEGEYTPKEETYISIGSKSESVNTVKGFLINVLGKFLLIANNGYKQYEYETTKWKSAHLSFSEMIDLYSTPLEQKDQAFYMGIFILFPSISILQSKQHPHKVNQKFLMSRFTSSGCIHNTTIICD